MIGVGSKAGIDILIGDTGLIPTALTITASATTLTTSNSTVRLTATATYPDNSTRNVTSATNGTSYTISNPDTATVSPDGLVTAARSGVVMISAINEGAIGFFRINVTLSNTDSDGDGIRDETEIDNGLNPNNPVDAEEDLDDDGLTNAQELNVYLTNIRVADHDGDGITDGDEVRGRLGFVTEPASADSDGDGVRDLLEIQTGSNPNDRNSFNLAEALQSLEVLPASFVLTVNTIIGEASRQLSVVGHLKDDTTNDLTSTTRGTVYSSDNLFVANFGLPDGNVFAGTNGTATITVSNSTFLATVSVIVRSSTPQTLSFVNIPGGAYNVDVNGNYAYVAAGSAGLQIVSISDRRVPSVVASLDTPGFANDVRVVGNLAFIADGPSGLRIINVLNPRTPALIASLDTPGDAQDVTVVGGRAYVADGSAGLQIVDITSPASPRLLGAVDTPGAGYGVDVVGNIAVVADGGSGIQVIDVSDPTQPTILGNRSYGGDARDVTIQSNHVFVADLATSFTSVDITDPRNPIVRTSTPRDTGGLLEDVAVAGRFAFGADIFFFNGIPIIDVVQPASPMPRAILDFRAFGDENGTGIAVDSSYVYLTAGSRLYIGQYLQVDDTFGKAPALNVRQVSPSPIAYERETILVSADASDDVGVAAVNVFMNGVLFGSASVPPFDFRFSAPVGINLATIRVEALDFAGNVTTRQVVLSIIPDPGTTVIGRVVDVNSNGVPGLTVSTLESRSTVTADDGTFRIANVPTIIGNIRVTARGTVGQVVLFASSLSVPPNRGGDTDVGTIVLRQQNGLTMRMYDVGDVPSAVANGFAGLTAGEFTVTTANDSATVISYFIPTINFPDTGVDTVAFYNVGPNGIQEPLQEAVGDDINIQPPGGNDGFGASFSGYLLVPQGGDVTFTITVDDAFDLIVNRHSVASSVGGADFADFSGTASYGGGTDFANFSGTARNLPSGLVPIVLNYGEIAGEAGIVLSASGGGLPGGVIPAEYLQPDPGTTVIGRAVGTNGASVAGAMVRVGGDYSAETDGNGEFRIANVPTLFGSLTVTVTGVVDGQVRAGVSRILVPVLGGLTDAGQIVLNEPAGLVAWWRADGDAQDSAGSNHGTLRPLVDGTSFAEGKLGQAFTFDGTDDYVDFPTQIAGNSYFTLSAWIQPNPAWMPPPGQTAPGAVICTQDGLIQYDPNTGFGLFIFKNRDGTVATINYSSRIRIAAGQWSHVAFAATSTNTGRFFVNGVEITLGSAIPDDGVTSNYRTTIGANARPDLYELFNGRIDEVRVYTRALGAAEIGAIYRAGSGAQDATTIQGLVTLTNGNPVAGATVSVVDLPNLSAVTGPDGRFVIANVPVAFGTLRLTAVVGDGAGKLIGKSGGLSPIPGGTTDAGMIALEPPRARIYVSNTGEDTVSVISLDTLDVLATIPVGDNPIVVEVAPDGRRAYVINDAEKSISVIDTASLTVIKTNTFGNRIDGLAISRDSRRIYVTSFLPSRIWVIDAMSYALINFVIPAIQPTTIALHPVRDELWLGRGAVEARSAGDLSLLASTDSGDYASADIAFNANGSEAFGAEGCGHCGRFHRISGNHLGDTISILDSRILYDNLGAAMSVAYNTVSGTAYLGKLGQNGGVHRVAEYRDGLGRNLNLDAPPRDLAVTVDGARLFVASQNAQGYVSIIDTATFTPVSRVNVGALPSGIAIWDPAAFTTVRGRILLTNGSPAVGAIVTLSIAGLSAVTLADGAFEISNVPVAPGDIGVQAALPSADGQLTGASGRVTPVRDGVTTVGEVTISLRSVWHEIRIPDLPEGITLGAVWARTPKEVYVWAARTAAGRAEAFLLRWDGMNWQESLHLPNHFGSRLFGTGDAEVFAVAHEYPNGVSGPAFGRVWRSVDNGTNWVSQVLPAAATNNTLGDIGGTPGNVHFAVPIRATGRIIRFDGTAWNDIFGTSGDNPFGVLTMLSATEGYFVGCWGWGGWNGTNWSYTRQFDFCDIAGVWGTRDIGGNLHLYAVGNNNFANGIRVWRFNEATRSFGSTLGFVFSDGDGFNVGTAHGIWGSSAGDVYVLGQLAATSGGARTGRLYHYDGTNWSRVTIVGDIPVPGAIHGTSSNDVWITLGDRILRFGVPTSIPGTGQVSAIILEAARHSPGAPPPEISHKFIAGGQVEIQVSGTVGRICVIEVSTDLIHWTSLTTTVATGTPQSFVDGNTTTNNCRFYRVRLVE